MVVSLRLTVYITILQIVRIRRYSVARLTLELLRWPLCIIRLGMAVYTVGSWSYAIRVLLVAFVLGCFNCLLVLLDLAPVSIALVALRIVVLWIAR